jgi:hypothetical protein
VDRSLGLHSLLTVYIRCNPCKATAANVYVGFRVLVWRQAQPVG